VALRIMLFLLILLQRNRQLLLLIMSNFVHSFDYDLNEVFQNWDEFVNDCIFHRFAIFCYEDIDI